MIRRPPRTTGRGGTCDMSWARSAPTRFSRRAGGPGRCGSGSPFADRRQIGRARATEVARALPGGVVLDVVVHVELVGMRAQADRVDLVGALVVDPRLDDVGREDA